MSNQDYSHLNWWEISKAKDAQYFTPPKVANVIYECVNSLKPKKEEVTVFDPTAGTGRLLKPFHQNKWPTVGVEYDEKLGIALKRTLNKEIVRVGNILDYYNSMKSKKCAVVVANPPFGLDWDVADMYFESAEYGCLNESQTITIEIINNLLVEEGLVALIVPTSSWTNAKDSRMRNYVYSNFNIIAKITIPDMFKKEYKINKPCDLVFMTSKSWRERNFTWEKSPYTFNRQEYELMMKDIHKVPSIFKSAIAGSEYEIPFGFMDISEVPDLSQAVEVYVDDKNLDLSLSKNGKLSGNEVAMALLDFYDATKLSSYNSVLGKETGLKQCYFSMPSLIKNGTGKTKYLCAHMGLTFDVPERLFSKLKKEWELRATPLFQPKAHELLAYYNYGFYRAKDNLEDESGEIIFKKGKKYLIKPTWGKHSEVAEANIEQDNKGEDVEVIRQIEMGHLELHVFSEKSVEVFPENKTDKIELFLKVFDLPEVRGIADKYPTRVKNWANVIVKKYPYLKDYQAEDLARLLCKKRNYVGYQQGGGKCNYKDALVEVNDSLYPIEEVYNQFKTKEWFDDEDGSIWSVPSKRLYVNSFNEGTRRFEKKKIQRLYKESVNTHLKRIELANGSELKITYSHKLLEVEKGWTNQLNEGDYIAIPKKINQGMESLNPYLAEFLGWQVSEGYELKNTNHLLITQKEKEHIENIRQVFNKLLFYNNLEGFKPRIKKINKCYNLEICSKQYRKLYESLGVKWGVLSKDRVIPERLMKCDNKTIAIFLSTLFEGDGTVNKDKDYIQYTSASLKLIKQIQYLLLRFGINSNISEKIKGATNGYNIKRKYYELTISSDRVEIFRDKIGFCFNRKKQLIEQISSENKNNNLYGIYVSDLFNSLIKESGWKSNFWGFSNLFEYGNKWGDAKIANNYVVERVIEKIDEFLSNSFYEKLLNAPRNRWYKINLQRYAKCDKKKIQQIKNELKNRYDSEIVYVKIQSIDNYYYNDWVYDLEVEDNHNFISENVLVHNTLISLCYAELRQYSRVLVICQGGLVDNWINEAEKWGFTATALKTHGDINHLLERVKKKDFVKHKTEFFIIGQEFLSLDSGKIFDTWECIKYNKDGKITHEEVSNKYKCSKGHKYDVMHTCCPKCGDDFQWSGKVCGSCGYIAYTYGESQHGAIGVRQYPAYKRLGKIFKFVVTDESQNFANRSLRGEASRAFNPPAKMLLTGTIMKNYVSEMFLNVGWLMNYNNPVFYYQRGDIKNFLDEYGSYEFVTRKYLNEIQHASSKNRKGGRKKLLPAVSNLNRFWKLITPFTVRRLSLDLDGLRDIERERVIERLPMDDDHALLYSNLQEWAKERLEKEFRKKEQSEVNMGVISTVLWKLRYGATIPTSKKLCDGKCDCPEWALSANSWNKIKRIVEICKSAKAKGDKTIVFSALRPMQSYIARIIGKHGLKVKFIPSSVSTNKRFAEIDDFSKNYDVLVSGADVLNRGYNIIAANHVVFSDITYTPEITDQGEFRVIRHGQEKKVYIYYLLSENTIDEDMLTINNEKRDAIEKAVDKKTDEQNIKDLLRQADNRNAELMVAKKILENSAERESFFLQRAREIQTKEETEKMVETNYPIQKEINFGEQLSLF